MTSWRGVTLDPRSAAMMDEVARLCPGITVDPTQGSYSGGVEASAGTHSGGGAIDIAAAYLTGTERDQLVLAMRRVGWAAWLRTPAQSDWPYHIHGIAVGCPDLSPAAAEQVSDYLAGRNGLASGAPDDGPRDFHYVGIMWEEYQAPQPKEEDDDMKPWLVSAGGSMWFTDLATYKTWCTSGDVANEAIQLGSAQWFANGNALGAGWVAFIDRLPRLDAD